MSIANDLFSFIFVISFLISMNPRKKYSLPNQKLDKKETFYLVVPYLTYFHFHLFMDSVGFSKQIVWYHYHSHTLLYLKSPDLCLLFYYNYEKQTLSLLWMLIVRRSILCPLYIWLYYIRISYSGNYLIFSLFIGQRTIWL